MNVNMMFPDIESHKKTKENQNFSDVRLSRSVYPSPCEIKANRPVPYQNVCKRFAHDQSSWVVTGVKKIQELI